MRCALRRGKRTPERHGYAYGYYGRTLVARVGKLGHARAAMQEQQGGPHSVLAADEHTLLHAVDVDVKLLRDASGEQLSVGVEEGRRGSGAEHRQRSDDTKNADKQQSGDDQHGSQSPS